MPSRPTGMLMLPPIQILVFLLIVIAAVAVLPRGSDSSVHPPGAHRRHPGAHPRPAEGGALAGVRSASRAAADHLLVGRGDELVRIPASICGLFRCSPSVCVVFTTGRDRRGVVIGCWASPGRSALRSAPSSRRRTLWRRSRSRAEWSFRRLSRHPRRRRTGE